MKWPKLQLQLRGINNKIYALGLYSLRIFILGDLGDDYFRINDIGSSLYGLK